MHTLEHHVIVDAAPDIVFALLADFAGHPRWNPYVRSWRGEPRVGARMELVGLPGGAPMRFRPELVAFDPPREIRYIHRLAGGLALTADHTILLEPLDGRTRVIQREVFTGAAVPLLRDRLDREALPGFVAMNHALKQAAERVARGEPAQDGPDGPHAMQAAVVHAYGPPELLHVETIARPTAGAGEVLVQVHAAGLNRGDAKRRGGELAWLASAKAPHVLGYDAAGIVVAVGPGVTGFAVGDRVLGMRSVPRGGTYAEYVPLRADRAARLADGVDFVAAAVTPLSGVTALQALRDHGKVRPGSRVLIHGASGGVGTFAVAIARALGAHVTGTCSAGNRELVASLGADVVVDYRAEDPLAAASPWDCIFDTVGALDFRAARPTLAPGGVFVTTVPSARVFFDAAWSSISKPRLVAFLVEPRRADLEQLAAWLADGTLRPVVERTFTLAEAAEAHRRLESGRTRGKLAFVVRGADLESSQRGEP